MDFRKFGIFMLGLGLTAAGAEASTTYNTAVGALGFDVGASALTLTTTTFTSDTCSNPCTSVIDANATFSSITQGLDIFTEAGWPDGNVLARSSGGGSISISPTGPIYGFGLSIVTLVGGGFPIEIEYNDGAGEDQSVTTASSGGSAIFFGVVSATPITNVQIVSNFNQLTFAIDDVQIGSAGAVATPEAKTMLLIGSGLIILYLLRRRGKSTGVELND